MVLDWVMPGVTGVDVCRFLRASGPAAQKIGILLLTVHRDTEQIVEGLSAGANDYLAKPYEDEELRARVGSLARTRELLEGWSWHRPRTASCSRRRPMRSSSATRRDGSPSSTSRRLAVLDGHAALQLLGRQLAELVPGLRAQSVDLTAGRVAGAARRRDRSVRGVFRPRCASSPTAARSRPCAT